MLSRSAVLNRIGVDGVDIETLRLDDPLSGEVLVKVSAAGLCHSDLHVINGTLGSGGGSRILGHEMAGVVVQVGDQVRSVKPGDTVLGCLAMACSQCDQCWVGLPHLCSQRASVWNRPAGHAPRAVREDGSPATAGSGIGAIAEYVLMSEQGVVAIPATMAPGPAALLSCGVLTGTGAVFRSAEVTPGSSVAVIGCGGVGMSIIQAARIAGATTIIAVDRSSSKLAQAGTFGATDTVLATGEGSHVQQVRDVAGGGGVNYAFEAIGLAATVQDAVAMLAPRGLATIVGVFPAGVDIHVPARQMLTGETRLQGSYMGSSDFRLEIPALCALYESGDLLLDEMIDPVIGLDQVRHGFTLMARGESLRPVVIFDS